MSEIPIIKKFYPWGEKYHKNFQPCSPQTSTNHFIYFYLENHKEGYSKQITLQEINKHLQLAIEGSKVAPRVVHGIKGFTFNQGKHNKHCLRNAPG